MLSSVWNLNAGFPFKGKDGMGMGAPDSTLTNSILSLNLPFEGEGNYKTGLDIYGYLRPMTPTALISKSFSIFASVCGERVLIRRNQMAPKAI